MAIRESPRIKNGIEMPYQEEPRSFRTLVENAWRVVANVKAMQRLGVARVLTAMK